MVSFIQFVCLMIIVTGCMSGLILVGMQINSNPADIDPCVGIWKPITATDAEFQCIVFYENGTGVYINLLTFEKINTYWTQRSETWMTVKFHTFAGRYSNFDISFTMLNANRIVNKNGSFYKIGDA